MRRLLSYAADDQSFRNITITSCRGIGLYIRGGDSNASDFYQINAQENLVGGIFDIGYLGNTHIAHNVTLCGYDNSTINGKPIPLQEMSCMNNVVTVITSEPHGLVPGQAAVLAGLADPSNYRC
jgi:hypothetical protein